MTDDTIEGQASRDNATVVTPIGDIDVNTLPSLRKEVDQLLADAALGTLMIDFSATKVVDSSGLGYLVGLIAECRDAGAALVVRNPPRRLTRIMQLTETYDLFTWEPADPAADPVDSGPPS